MGESHTTAATAQPADEAATETQKRSHDTSRIAWADFALAQDLIEYIEVHRVLAPGFDQSADIPLLVNNANGLTVVPAFLVDSLSLVPALQIDDTFAVSAGASSEFPFATLLAPPHSEVPAKSDARAGLRESVKIVLGTGLSACVGVSRHLLSVDPSQDRLERGRPITRPVSA